MRRLFDIGAVAFIAAVPSGAALGVTLTECLQPQIRDFACEAATPARVKNHIHVVGKVTSVGSGAYGKTRLSIEVLQASMNAVASRIDIDVDPCLRSIPQEDDSVNVYVWQRPSPNTGAYALAPCAR
jgi:hypothetical protein